MENLVIFKKRIRRLTEHRKHKIRGSLGVYDAYKYYRKNKPKEKKYILTESQYFSIIRQVNNIVADNIANGKEIVLPYRMGIIELRKFNTSIKIGENGEVITNLPIDWDSTIKLWYEDEDAYTKKTLIRFNEQEQFKIVYNKSKANYNNKFFYNIKFHKELKVNLKRNIKKGKVDAFEYTYKNKY